MSRRYKVLGQRLYNSLRSFAVKSNKHLFISFTSLLAAYGCAGPISDPIVINSNSASIESLATLRKGVGNKNFSPCLSYVYALDGAVSFEPPTSSRGKCSIDEYKIAAGEYVLTVYCGDNRGMRAYPRVKVSFERGKDYVVNCHATYKHNVGGIGVGFPMLEAVLVPVESSNKAPGA